MNLGNLLSLYCILINYILSYHTHHYWELVILKLFPFLFEGDQGGHQDQIKIRDVDFEYNQGGRIKSG